MTPYFADEHLTVYHGDARAVMAEMEPESVHCVVTSPPYWGLRDYGTPGQLGLEPTPEEYVANLVGVFREVRRVLRDDGTVWLNLGDSYNNADKWGGGGANTGKHTKSPDGSVPSWMAVRRKWAALPGLKHKDLVGIPWRVAFALQADGWYLRSDIIWAKPNPMPESVTDRPTKAHEYVFLLSKSPRYYFDAEAVRERAESGPSDLRKMAEGRERIGGLVKEQTDPLLAASGLTNIGRKRSVGGRPLRSQTFARSGPVSEHILPGQTAAQHRSDRTDETPAVGRNIRSVWTIATQPYPGAHFATFPRKLVEPCVKAGTSERGVCPECGTPWERITAVTGRVQAHWEGTEQTKARTAKGAHGATSVIETGSYAVRETTGWRPSCAHDAAPVPATILDMFAGSGTVGLVAQQFGRRAILIDLSMDYLGQLMVRNAQKPLGLIG